MRQRPQSEDFKSPNEAAGARRPSAPLIRTPFAATVGPNARERKPSRPHIHTAVTAGFVAHMTPPETPMSPSPDFETTLASPQSLFHNYLRAMHPFDPSADSMPGDDASQSAVAIRPGDLILVHCIHANGWADGTVLNTGNRGWLPTNYCEAYDHPYLRNLLNAMTQFWDLLGANEDANLSTFVRQDYIRGLIAGVRYLLERADCLHRDAPSVKNHVGVRRMRKGLLADLSSLVQIAKRLQDTISEPFAGEVIHVLLDDLICKAFKVVTRAISFTDVWSQEVRPAKHELNRLLVPQGLETPPIESSGLAIDTSLFPKPGVTPIDSAIHFPDHNRTQSNDDVAPGADNEAESGEERKPRLSMIFTPPDGLAAHRVSLVAKDNHRAMSGPLASEQLAKVHDICISHIGAFIGHHLHSRPSSELVATTERLVKACRNMLTIVDEVYAHDHQGSQAVQQAKSDFEVKLEELAKSTKDVFRFSDSPDDEVIMMPDQTNHLINVGTSLIRNTGECVVRTRQLIEQIGDFELKTSALASSRAAQEIPERGDSLAQNDQQDDDSKTRKRVSTTHRLSKTVIPPPPPIPDDVGTTESTGASATPQPETTESGQDTPTVGTTDKPLPPPPRQRSVKRASHNSSNHVESLKSPRSFRSSSTSPARKDSVGMSIAGSTDTCYSSTRDSSITAVSQASTRATTPDQPKDSSSSDPALMNSFASISSLKSVITDDSIDAEQLLQKTYAHELTFNKEGQVAGGSLPALVEQLTTHDSAPDPQFVTAFFLTFRKFCEPREFAQTLIHRFDYIGDSRTVGTPARLRIYNVFKGWLETYWSADADKDALGEIRFFALHKLKQVLPAAGERLAELTKKVTEGYANGTITGPLVSGVGKTSLSFSHDDASMPEPIITVKQLNALRVATGGGAQVSILDFDPIEIARQITLLVVKAYCEIRPEELLSMDWGKPNTKKAKSVRKMCLLNTDLAHLVSDTILQPDDAKKRAKVIKQWVKIGTACLELCNYDSVMAIMCQLNSSPVQRLKKTWDLVNKKTIAELQEIDKVADMSKNYNTLRRLLESPTAPCLPFLGVYLTDLTFVIAGNPKRRELPGVTTETGDTVSVINFDMYSRIAKIISHLQKFQVPYKLKQVPEMQTWMDQHLKRMRDGHDEMVSTFHRRSLSLEPKPEDRKHSIFRLDTDERPKTAASRPEASPMDRFDFFHKSSSLLNMRSQTTLNIADAASEQKRASAQ
ncbi:hypothetical protein M409DRAFT_54573 [Zasmidium cellare ATCC 36951]|uniref:Ras GEF n=1 Tax=Zasmidium cellare ATCC 36951 TaxID=1080233 RepID=A0A6A6CM26_ZASCE|nr:uncharacterized protein M409DRAFT_54573 [Zasmidium cellare ATCC 36951]KAF2166789.1 hypothetical protein M409DRAFT_54573 [Zasmidium cellare ATCC 36951]